MKVSEEISWILKTATFLIVDLKFSSGSEKTLLSRTENLQSPLRTYVTDVQTVLL